MASDATSFWRSVDNFRTMDGWITALNNEASGLAQTGYRAKRITFTGGQTTSTAVKGGLNQGAELTMSTSTARDFSNGDIVSSTDDTHLAIKGNGFFMVASSLAAGTLVHYTREGEFHRDDTIVNQPPLPTANGYWRDVQGNYLLSGDDVDPSGNFVRTGGVFGPGALGVTDQTYYTGLVTDTWSLLTTGGFAGGTTTFNENFESVVPVVGAPSASQWTISAAPVAGKNDTPLFGAGNDYSSHSVGWGVSGFGANAGTKGLYYGDQNNGNNFQTGIAGSMVVPTKTNLLGFGADWTAGGANNLDIRVLEGDGATVSVTSPAPYAFYHNGFVNRDQQFGNRTGGVADPDEAYELEAFQPNIVGYPTMGPMNMTYFDQTITPTPTYTATKVAEGNYSFYIDNLSGAAINTNYWINNQLGTVRDYAASGGTYGAVAPTAISVAAGNMVAPLKTIAVADRENKGTVTSPQYLLAGAFTGATVTWKQKAQVEATPGGALPKVDDMQFRYSVDNGVTWSANQDAKVMGNTGGWGTVGPIALAGIAGAPSVQFQWAFDTGDSYANNTFGWAIDNLSVTATGAVAKPSDVVMDVTDVNGNAVPPGSVLEVLDASGNLIGSSPIVPAYPVVATTVTVPITTVPAGTWPQPNATLRVRNGATIICSHTYSNPLDPVWADDHGTLQIAYRRGFEAAEYATPKTDLKDSPLGRAYLDPAIATKIPTFQRWGTQNAGMVIRNALEASNVTVGQVAPELNLAKTIYANLTKVLECKSLDLDGILSLIR